MDCRLGNSSFHGRIKEIPGIAVDNFIDIECRAYFLSHCHSDHTEGLFSLKFQEAVRQNNVYIYMSEVTADIIIKTSRVLEKNIIKLKVGNTDITLPQKMDYEEQYISVTALPAGHCFGSIMFLFQTKSQTILYTGDFRMKENDVPKLGHLHDKYHQPININVMYVDTTFLDKKYISFPKRNTCIEKLIDIIKDWLGSDLQNAVAINTPAKFGYEFVFNEIAKQLDIKVYVNDDRYKFYREYKDVITGVTNVETDTRIHLCATCRETNKHNFCITKHEGKRFLLVRLTAMKWIDYDLEESPVNRVSEDKVYACFPTHCSRSELIYFVNYFSPKHVYGFPEEYKEQKSPTKHFPKVMANHTVQKRKNIDDFSKSPKKEDKKVPPHVLREIFKL